MQVTKANVRFGLISGRDDNAALTFKRGMDAHNNPNFYRQIGREPGQIVANALEVLARRFSLR